MSDFRKALVSYLLADTAIAAVVGDRVVPFKLDQGDTGPSIVYQTVSSEGDHHMGGPSGLERERLQIDCWASSRAAAYSLAKLVKARLDGFRGVMGSGGDATTVQGVFFQEGRDAIDETAKLFNRGADYRVVYEASN